MSGLSSGEIATPLGALRAVTHGATVLVLEWADQPARIARHLARLGADVAACAEGVPASMRAALGRYFAGEAAALDALHAAPCGTDFQRACWAALRTIPPGTTATYAATAARLGLAGAARAVGAANAANPVSLVVPCHRLVGAGGLTGYGGGLARKRWLLDHEARAACPAMTAA